MSDVEGIGEIVTGAAIARAVEPGRGAADTDRDGHTHEKNCLNCGTPLTGPYCHGCGQHAHVHRTIGAWWHDFTHSVLHLDGKFWRTLPMLVWRPGELTRNYASGQRARYISPLALFLFSVFAMFAVFSVIGTGFGDDPSGIQTNLQGQIAEDEERLEKLERERFIAAASKKSTERLDERISRLRDAIALEREIGERGVLQGTAIRASDDLPSWLSEPIAKASKNPDLLIYKLKANGYKFSWALIPLSLPFVWLLFLHRRRYRRFTGYDHIVFITYSITFVTLALILLALLRAVGIGSAVVSLILLALPAIHMFRQLRGAYNLSVWSALWRTAALLFIATNVITLFIVMLLGMGALG